MFPYPVRIQRHGWIVAIALGCLALMLRVYADETPPATNAKLVKQLKELYRADAAQYTLFLNPDREQKSDLREEPVYVWTNAIREQTGSVFLWTWRGRPTAIGTIFSNPEPNHKRVIVHELHSLSPTTLSPRRESPHRWEPKSGLKRTVFPHAPTPADNPRQRLIQMRELAKLFSARSVDLDQQQWELRQLTQPLYRYQSTDPEVVDGALFAWVTSAGTDPEVVIVIEDIVGIQGPHWHYAICRFSDNNLFVKLEDDEVWSMVRSDTNTWDHDPNHLYRLFVDRRIDEVTE